MTAAIFVDMGNATSETIQQGKLLLYIGLIGLVVLHLVGVLLTVMTDGLADMDRLYLWRAAVVVVGGLGTLRGGNPVRYIYTFVLLLLVIAGIFGMWVEEESLLWQMLGLLNGVFAAFLIYLLMFNDTAAEFLAAQGAKYFGFSGGGSVPATPREKAEKSKTDSATEADGDAWDTHDDLYE